MPMQVGKNARGVNLLASVSLLPMYHWCVWEEDAAESLMDPHRIVLASCHSIVNDQCSRCMSNYNCGWCGKQGITGEGQCFEGGVHGESLTCLRPHSHQLNMFN